MQKEKENKKNLLEQVRAEIIKNNVCPDLAQSATNLVMGDGNLSAELLFVGEAPGKNEDLTGLPFVGQAGKFLDEMLASIDLKREDIYITNIVKYRPPNNRDPLPDEKSAFWPYLLKQIEIIKPKVIVTLGRHSLEYFLPGEKITQIHGSLMQVNINAPLYILPLYHPAAALYNGGLRQTLMDDFKKIPMNLKIINKTK